MFDCEIPLINSVWPKPALIVKKAAKTGCYFFNRSDILEGEIFSLKGPAAFLGRPVPVGRVREGKNLALNAAAGPGRLFLGLDVGSISVKAALIDEEGRLADSLYLRHQGRPFVVLEKALGELTRRFSAEAVMPPAVTGTGAGDLARLLGGEVLNEIMALTLAAETCPGAGSLIDIGGEDTKVLWLDREKGGLADFAMNDLCAAGTGSFLDQQAHRLGYSLDEFGRLALKSRVPPRVAGRCSVFAKSDMIHLQQAATPDYEIVYGLCLAMARSLKSGLVGGRALPAPVLFTGGVAANPGLRRALSEVLGLSEEELFIPETHLVFGALGAALGARQSRPDGRPGLNLAPLSAFAARDHHPPELQAPLPAPSGRPEISGFEEPPAEMEVYLGVDVGSVSTNVVLITPGGRLVLRRYLPTAGRPLEALRAAFADIPDSIRTRTRVLGACTTGSGRYLSADYLGADLTVNEITAQAAAAVAIDPRVDTIFEIGGQDSKYIALADGVIVDFMMNKACAAGTGSFLEEQAEKLGLAIKDEFGAAALAAKAPVLLGERCTVFMESDLVHHQQKGVGVEDLAAGLCYGIVANYLGRVVETRPVGRHIFFQGGTSFNPGVHAAFEARLNRPITVPDNADVTGAIGAALVAKGRRTWAESRFVGFDLGPRTYEIKSFECSSCDNRCEIRQVSVAGGKPLNYGDRCGRFEEEGRKAAPSKWPDLFEYRAELAFNSEEMRDILARGKVSGRRTMGLMRSMFLSEMGPFWSVFWARLGFLPVWSRPTDKGIIHKGCEKTGGEFCFPVKAAHGHLADLMERGLDHIFLPSVVNLPPGGEGGKQPPDTAACPYVQALPYYAGPALRLAPPRLVGGPVFFGEGDETLFQSLADLAGPLGLDRAEIKTAMFQALLAQDLFNRRLLEKGREVLEALGPKKRALVVVARPYNGFDPGLNLRLNRKLADLGLLGIPMDFLPLDTGRGEAASHYWRYGQKITAAADFIARDPRLSAVYITNFGCGPDSFILHFFKHQLGGRPFLEIEIDEHSSDVGAVTRLEAFLDSLAARREAVGPPSAPPPLSVTRAPRLGQALYLPFMCDHVLAAAAVFRGAGYMAEVLPPSDRKTVELGRSQTSGKECYPLILTVGDFLKLTRRPDFNPDQSAFFMPSAYGPCRFGQYGRYLRLVLERLGLGGVDVVSIDQTGGMYKDLDSGGGRGLSGKIWRALAATDILSRARHQTRARGIGPEPSDLAYKASLADLVTALEAGQNLAPVMNRARERFEAAVDPAVPSGLRPRVGLVGEIYARYNDFANEGLVRRLEELGAEVMLPPFTEWVLYLNFLMTMRARRAGDLKKRLAAGAVGWLQKREMKKLAAPWQGFFLAAEPPISEMIGRAEKFIHPSFQGEAILSLGKGLEFFHHRAAGLVNIMPFTCMPGMVVGGLTQSLRAACRGLPSLNLSFDGQSQTNTQARLEAFMGQVRAFHSRRERESRP